MTKHRAWISLGRTVLVYILGLVAGIQSALYLYDYYDDGVASSLSGAIGGVLVLIGMTVALWPYLKESSADRSDGTPSGSRQAATPAGDPGSSGFWSRPDVVRRFAERDPDDRLRTLVEEYPDPGSVRALDLGCAGGRNAVFLARKGFDVRAVDGSPAMVAETRRRLAAILGELEAGRRVTEAKMDHLPGFDDASFDLVVSLGLLHNAVSWAEWRRAAAETARVLAPGGRLLVSQFTPATDFRGDGIRKVSGEPHLYDALPHGPGILLEPGELDEEMARLGLEPERPTTTGRTELHPGQRVSAKGLYRKRRPITTERGE